MHKKVSAHVDWVGKTDWEKQHASIPILSCPKGTSYNAYLIHGNESIALLDTVPAEFDAEFVSELSALLDLNDIDCIILTSASPERSGALCELLAYIPGTPIYCTKEGEDILKSLYQQDWNFVQVQSEDRLDLGGVRLTFLPTNALDWPDALCICMETDKGEHTLFGGSVLACHYASETLFDQDNPVCEIWPLVWQYQSLSIPQKDGQSLKRLQTQLESLPPAACIAPAHGVLWRKEARNALKTWLAWSQGRKENQIIIVYATLYGSTRKLAQAIAQGIQQADQKTKVCLYNVQTSDPGLVLSEIAKSKALIAGSASLHGTMLTSMYALLKDLSALHLHARPAAVFASSTWSSQTQTALETALKEAGFDVWSDVLEIQGMPDAKALARARKFGADFAKIIS